MKTRRPRRKPTNRHLAKMRAGRERIAREQRRQWRAAMDNYHDWLKLESAHYYAVIRARELFGADSDEARDAEQEWRAAITLMPPLQTLPDDSTWRRLRGDHGDDSHARIATDA